MTLAELRARLEEIQARMKAIDEEFRDAVLPDESQTEWDSLDAEFKEKRTQLEAIEARHAAMRDEARNLPANSTQREKGSDPGAPNFVPTRTDAEVYDLAAIRSASNSPEDFSRRLVDNSKRAIERAKLSHLDVLRRDRPGVKQDADASRARMEGLLENIDDPDMLAKRMLLTGTDAYERAFGKWMRYGNDAMCTDEERRALQRAQALGTDSAGGFAVPFQLDPTVVLTNAGTQNPLREVATVKEIVGKQYQMVTSAGATASRGAEGAVAPDNTMALAQPVISTNRVQGFVPFNIEIELAWGALRTEITKVLLDAKDREEDSFVTGDGTGDNPGGLIGSFTAAGGVYVTTAASAAFAAADVYSLQANLPVRWERNSAWLAHKGIYHRLRQFDTAGGAQLWARIGDGQPPRLLDYPDYRVSAMANVLTTGTSIMAYGDFKSGFYIVDRLGMNVELVPQLFDTTTGRPTGQRGVYAIWMNNSKIVVPQAYQVLKTQ